MKKKAITILLTLMMAASALAGCGNKAAVNAEPGSTETVQSTEEETEEVDVEPETTATPDTQATEELETEDTAESTFTADTEAKAESTDVTKSITADAEATETPEAESSATVYTYTDMNQTMWAKSSVNVRALPSTDGNKVGSLKGGQEVTVTGQCNETGWYQLENGNFVSNKYLSETKVTVNTTDSAGSTAADGTSTTDTTASGGASTDFINYLNQKRAEQGLSALEWDSTLEANAVARAQQLASDFSHNGGSYAENIASVHSTSYVDWFNTWNASEGHKANMFSSGYAKAACAYYNVGGTVYIITVFQGNTSPASSEELQQKIDSGELVVGGSSVDANTGAGVTTYIDSGTKTLEEAVQDGDITQEEANEIEDMFNEWASEYNSGN